MAIHGFMIHKEFEKSQELRFKISNGENDLNFPITSIDCFKVAKDSSRCVVDTHSHHLYSFQIGYKGDTGLYTLGLSAFRKAGNEFKYSDLTLSGSYLVAKATTKTHNSSKISLHVYKCSESPVVDLFWSMRPEEYGLESDFKHMSFITFDTLNPDENTLMISNTQAIHLYTIGDLSINIPKEIDQKLMKKIEIAFEADKDAKYTRKSLVSVGHTVKGKKEKSGILYKPFAAKTLIWAAVATSIVCILVVLLLAIFHTLRPKKEEEDSEQYDYEAEVTPNL